MSGKSKPFGAILPLTVGFASVVLLVGSLGVWSVGTEIAGAIVATGTVRVQSERQVVQHPDGGVVGEILARDGDTVAAGDVLLRLDGTFLRSELAIIERQLAETFARRARLIAERDDTKAPDFDDPPAFQLVAPEALKEQINGQTRLFAARKTSLRKELQQLDEQQSQIERQIEGTKAQLTALSRQSELVSEELTDVQKLYDQNLVQASRLLTLQREAARLQGEIGRLSSVVAEARKRISELEIEGLKLRDQRREEAITQLRDLGFSEIELQERRISLTERLARLEIRAPVSGTIFGSRFFALQSVLQAAEPILYLVPSDQPLEVAARIDPIDIDQVFAGQNATLVFSAFNLRDMPEIQGRVLRVSADAEEDEATGIPFYEAILLPDSAVLSALPEMRLVPGMPVETFLRTEDRTPLSYLTQPLTQYFNRAFRE